MHSDVVLHLRFGQLLHFHFHFVLFECVEFLCDLLSVHESHLFIDMGSLLFHLVFFFPNQVLCVIKPFLPWVNHRYFEICNCFFVIEIVVILICRLLVLKFMFKKLF
jgi:hypothetical protein